jgi:hypothetical protein
MREGRREEPAPNNGAQCRIQKARATSVEMVGQGAGRPEDGFLQFGTHGCLR